MLRLLALAPLLFATSLLAEEDDQLHRALKRRIEASERVLRLTEKQHVARTVKLDAEVELAEARLDAAADPLERTRLLSLLVGLCRERVEATRREGRTGPEPVERAQFAWLQARLRALHAAYEDTDELGAGEEQIEGRRKYLRVLAGEALEAAKKCDQRLHAEWDAGTAAAGYRLQAVDDVLYAQMELAENEDERCAARAARLKTLTDIYPIARHSSRYFPYGEVRDAWLRARMAVELDKGGAASPELQQLREVRLELMMTELRFFEADIRTRQNTVSYCKVFVESILECPAEYMTPDQRRLLASQLFWVLSLVREELPGIWGDNRADFAELELAELAVLESKVRIWDLRRSAEEPPPPKVLPGE